MQNTRVGLAPFNPVLIGSGAAEPGEADAGLMADSTAELRPGSEALDDRIRALEQEWPLERIIEITIATLALAGVLLAVTSNRQWLFFSAGVLSFLTIRGATNWAAGLPWLRRCGARTQAEISQEKHALKTLRGDFSVRP